MSSCFLADQYACQNEQGWQLWAKATSFVSREKATNWCFFAKEYRELFWGQKTPHEKIGGMGKPWLEKMMNIENEARRRKDKRRQRRQRRRRFAANEPTSKASW